MVLSVQTSGEELRLRWWPVLHHMLLYNSSANSRSHEKQGLGVSITKGEEDLCSKNNKYLKK